MLEKDIKAFYYLKESYKKVQDFNSGDYIQLLIDGVDFLIYLEEFKLMNEFMCNIDYAKLIEDDQNKFKEVLIKIFKYCAVEYDFNDTYTKSL